MNRKTSGIALTGFAAVLTLLAFTPASASLLPTGSADSPVLFGMAELTLKNGDGDILTSQTVHNRLLDEGEATLIGRTFGATGDTAKPAAICITDKSATLIADEMGTVYTGPQHDAAEALTASDFTPAPTFAAAGTPTCIRVDNAVSTTISTDLSSVALNATFAGGDNIIAGEEITSLVICDSDFENNNDNCAQVGRAFSAVSVGATAVGATDTVEVTYTFDLSSRED